MKCAAMDSFQLDFGSMTSINKVIKKEKLSNLHISYLSRICPFCSAKQLDGKTPTIVLARTPASSPKN